MIEPPCLRIKRVLSGVLFMLLCFALPIPAEGEEPPRHVNVIELDNQIISPVTQQYIFDAIKRSEEERAECLVLMLDTPGGLLESTRAIVKRIMNAKVPVIVYVAPSGARAGSAGVFITLAGHIAAMAPSTNIGAAHPVVVGEGGGPVKKLIRRIKRAAKDEFGKPKHPKEEEEELVDEEQRDPMSEKIMNDTVAWVTTIAHARHRNEAWAKQAVTESVSVTEEAAVTEGIVDLVAKNLDDLLAQIDGRSLAFPEGEVTLATKEATVTQIALTPRQRFLAVITNPNIAYLLMLLGTLGLIFEFTHPGIGFPGIAGLICLILALYAFQTLPVNYAALALIGVGLALLIAEVKVAGFGLLALGGVTALTLGSLMLFDTPEGFVGVSLTLIVPIVAGVSAIVLFLMNLAVRAHRQPVTTGAQGIIGTLGVAETALQLEGQVFVHGELWRAIAKDPIRKGERVTVTGIDGLTLFVERSHT